MRTIISTETNFDEMNDVDRYHSYNCFDSLMLPEIKKNMMLGMDSYVQRSYDFSRAMQMPAMIMMRRGIMIDSEARLSAMLDLGDQRRTLLAQLKTILEAIGVYPDDVQKFSQSPKQLKEFLYEKLDLPVQYKFDKGEKKVSTDRDALEKLADNYLVAKPYVHHLLKLRDNKGEMRVLGSGIDQDGRMRCSYNITGTDTGRWSSNKNVRGGGTNFQNIQEPMRVIFIPDLGFKMRYTDLKSAESEVVGCLAGDEAYLEAVRSGDIHTWVARLCWPELPWTGKLKEDRKIAERPYYRHHSYRYMAKRGGHLSNYMGGTWMMSKSLKISRKICDEFQELYFEAFSGIPLWHESTAAELQEMGYLITPLGRKRHFLGRLADDATIRKAVAFRPQSVVGDLLNIGMWSVANHLEPRVQLLAQVHDAILTQEKVAADYGEEIISHLRIPIEVIDMYGEVRSMTIPATSKTGKNWMEASG